MKSMVLTDYKRLEIQDMPMPEVGPRDVRMRVSTCGICGSDVHGFDGSSGRRIPPLIMGHEAAGTVESVGPEVESLGPGDRVTFDSMISCGACRFCRAGEHNLCDNRRVVGVSPGEWKQHGAFAEYVVVPQHIVFRLPDGLSFEHAAMVEPVSVAVHAVNRTPIRLGDRAVVVGCGMIGLLTIQAAKAAGCGTVFAVDLDDTRLERAARLGADVTISAKDDVPRRWSPPPPTATGADVAFEAVGAAKPIATAIESLRKGGTLTLIGNVTPRVEVDLQAIVTRELTLAGTCASSGEYPLCLDLLGRGVDQGRRAGDRGGAARGRSRLVRAALRPRAGPDEGHPPAVRTPMSDSHNFFDLTGKTAVVTGASRGLGQYLARALARAGADLVITARDAEDCAGFRAEMAALGRTVVALSLDVRDPASIESFAAPPMDAVERVDILVNNAGCNVRKPSLDITWDDWNLVLDTNLRGMFFVSQAIAKRSMIPNGYGRIINIGSYTTVAGFAGLAPYCASRGGVRQMTMALADDWGIHGITVNCLSPGWFKTEQNKVLYEDTEWVEYLCDRIPLKRPGRPGTSTAPWCSWPPTLPST